MYHSFLIHLFTDGHLGCFQHLANVSCAAMNVGVHRFKQQVLARMWRKGNPSALLVGMQTGAATVENGVEFPQKTKNGSAF